MWNLQYYRIVFFFAYIIFIGIFRKCECVKLQNDNDDSTIINAPNTILGDGEGKELEMGTCDEKDQIIKQLTTDANQWRNMKDREEYIATKCKDWKDGRNDECHMLLSSEELQQGITFICPEPHWIGNWWKQVYVFMGVEKDSSSSGDVKLSLIKYYLDLDGLVAFANSACQGLWKQDKSCYTRENIYNKYIRWEEMKAEDINADSVALELEGCWQSPIALPDQYNMRRISDGMFAKNLALDRSTDKYILLKDWRFLGSKNSEEVSYHYRKDKGSYKAFLYWRSFFQAVIEGERWIPGTVAHSKKTLSKRKIVQQQKKTRLTAR
jgi:hypothetical protein